ncbi:hypothetical protein GFS60_07013 (plasmid) [Rhodococcus sp. WAY2]|nr:hypothetical protein GFS60_07013 [Rhodococcus sp. WAY2]
MIVSVTPSRIQLLSFEQEVEPNQDADVVGAAQRVWRRT